MIDDKLEDVLKLIPVMTQRSTYVSAVNSINFAYKKLHEYVKVSNAAPCIVNKSCLSVRSNIAERYVVHFVVGEKLHHVVEGVLNGFPGFGDPLLKLVQKEGDCDVDRMQILARAVTGLVYKAGQVGIVKEAMHGMMF